MVVPVFVGAQGRWSPVGSPVGSPGGAGSGSAHPEHGEHQCDSDEAGKQSQVCVVADERAHARDDVDHRRDLDHPQDDDHAPGP